MTAGPKRTVNMLTCSARTVFALFASAFFGLSAVICPASANDTGSQPAQRTVAQQKESASKETKPRSAGNDELFRRLLGQKSNDDSSSNNPLEQAIDGMRDARKRIEQKKTGRETREIQQRVIDHLEKLIELAKQQQSQSSPSDNRQRQAQNQSQQRQQPERDRLQSPQADDGTGRPAEDRKADKSSTRTRIAKKPDTGPGQQVDMVKAVWGHLPPALRDKLLRNFNEKYLQKYDELVHRYFESLAEEGRANRSRIPNR